MIDPFPSLPSTLRSCQGVETEWLDPLAGDVWDSHVTARTDHSVFHRAAWARILAEAYGHRPVYLRIMVAGVEAALVPLMEVRSPLTGRRGVSLPFADFAGPLWTGPRREAAVYQVLQGVAAERKWKHLELRGGSSPAPAVRAFRTYRAHELDLSPGISQLAKGLPESTRRSIHKAERSGLTVTVGRDPHDMVEFYQLHGRTRRRHGLPPQPFGFFQAICRHLIEPGLGEILLAHHAGAAVAGAVFFHSGGRAVYKFGASDKEHWNLRPNHWVMWKAIQHLVETGCRSLHFGRTSDTDAGLIRFKHSWACVDGTLSYFRYHTGRQAWIADGNPPAESLPMIFGHLPISLNRIAGCLIYPHLD
jgi:CelD/BcsL family acetyltransferase involved in cellulose biosynthesis